MLRMIYLTVFAILSSVAGVFYYSETRQETAIVATQDLTVGHQVQDSDLANRSVNPGSLPPGIVHAREQAVGQFVAFPILNGQFLQSRHLTSGRSGRLLKDGLDIPPGFRIISLPVSPPTAVGGALKPGDLVDVMAIPNGVKTATGEDLLAAPNILGRRVLVLGLRTDQGTDPDAPEGQINLNTSKAGSILLAVPVQDEAKYSLAVSTSTFFLALNTD